MGRLAVMAHYDPRGEVGPHVRRHVEALGRIADRVVVVSTAELTDGAERWLSQHAELIRRTNYGYDFFSYKTGLDSADLADYDDVVICNDTFVGPLVPYEQIFATMQSRPADFWGLTSSQRLSPHLQSYFVCFRPWLVQSQAFTSFWGGMRPISDRTRVITQYEIGMTRDLQEAGFAWDAYYRPSETDLRLARLRTWWWGTRRLHPGRDRAKAREEMRIMRRGHWNPSAALADAGLADGRLPVVKIDTLRYDPYGLGAERLLRLGEQRCPEAFADVRQYLADTAPFYPGRDDSRLRPAPLWIRPVRPLVEYGRGL